MNNDCRHTKRLKKIQLLAQDASQMTKHRHAAAIYIGTRLVSVGVNKMKSHPLQAKFGRNSDAIYIHAEIDAIKNALKRIRLADLENATLYVAKAKATNSKPCEGCQKAIIHFGIKKVFWTG
jgi:deoxycytidylate deaminase